MEITNQEFWEEGLKNNQDPYGACVYRYAQKWADLMEAHIKEGKELKDIAEEDSHTADKGEGITGFMYGCAVGILASCWKHGEELRRWHNLKTQLGNEGERANEKGTVLNPAVINIG